MAILDRDKYALLIGLVLLPGLTACDDPFDDHAAARPSETQGEGEGEIPVIYGGGPVSSCAWPTTVSLGGSCTGTLIHPQLVAYAAHCGTNYASIRFGDDISGNTDGFSVATQYCRRYPGYNDLGIGNGVDFAYCKLAQPVEQFPIVPPLMGCETEVLQSPGRASRSSASATPTMAPTGSSARSTRSSTRSPTTTRHSSAAVGRIRARVTRVGPCSCRSMTAAGACLALRRTAVTVAPAVTTR